MPSAIQKYIAGLGFRVGDISGADFDNASIHWSKIYGAPQTFLTPTNTVFVSSGFTDAYPYFSTLGMALANLTANDKTIIVYDSVISGNITINKELEIFLFSKIAFNDLRISAGDVRIYGTLYCGNLTIDSGVNIVYIENLRNASNLTIDGNNVFINAYHANNVSISGAGNYLAFENGFADLTLTNNNNTIHSNIVSSISLNYSGASGNDNNIFVNNCGQIRRTSGNATIHANKIYSASGAIIYSGNSGRLTIKNAKIESSDAATVQVGDNAEKLYLQNCQIKSLTVPISTGASSIIATDNCTLYGGTYGIVGTGTVKNLGSGATANIAPAVVVQGQAYTISNLFEVW